MKKDLNHNMLVSLFHQEIIYTILLVVQSNGFRWKINVKEYLPSY